MKKWLFIVILAFMCNRVISQSDSICQIRISVLTCAPGQELYSLFGHSALRITDTAAHRDVVYNWGTFDFTQPGFYTDFMRGKLLYYVSAWTMPEFMYEYQASGRAVYEQILDANCADKKAILEAVAYNLKTENLYYKYDFLLDNCTTRIRDIILKNIKPAANVRSVVDAGTTHRNLIHQYLDKGHQPWSKLGIDILLGSKLDEPVTIQSSYFLPEFFMKGLSLATASGRLITPATNTILKGGAAEATGSTYTPLIAIAIFCVLLYFCCKISGGKFAFIVDALLMLISGLLGIILLFMWWGTDHTVCQNNWNLIWAFPLNFFIGFLLKRNYSWLRYYFMAMAILSGLLLVGWFWWPQELNIAIAPFVLLLFNRYIARSAKKIS